MHRNPPLLLPLLLTIVVTLAAPGRAVLVMEGDGRRLEPPTGALANSGWQYEGTWGSFLGTAIAPHFFLTAKHVGGAVGQTFVLRGHSYTSVERIASPSSDLAVWRVEETLPEYAPLFSGTDEVGRRIIVFGRGTARGAPLYHDGQPRGWLWGRADHAQSWGTNTVATLDPPIRKPILADQKLIFTFDARSGAAQTCDISTGDSGGGVFTCVGGRWELVGTVWGLNTGFSLTPTGRPFSAALFDSQGMYGIRPGTKTAVRAPSGTPCPGIWFATRIAANRDFLRNALATGSRPARMRAVPARLIRFAGFLTLWVGAVLLPRLLSGRRRHRALSTTPPQRKTHARAQDEKRP